MALPEKTGSKTLHAKVEFLDEPVSEERFPSMKRAGTDDGFSKQSSSETDCKQVLIEKHV